MKKESNKTDVDILNKNAWDEHRKNPELAIEISTEALKQARSAKYVEGEADAIHTIGASYCWLSQF